MNLEKTIETFNQLQDTPGKNDKIAIIAENKDNNIFIESLKFLLDGSITTGIAKKKYEKFKVSNGDWQVFEHELDEEYLNLLNYLKTHNTGKDEDILLVKSFCEFMNDEIKNFIKGMATKSIKLGVDYKSANKAIPGLLTVHEVMLGTPLDKVKLKGDEWIALSRKLNGSRCSQVDGKLLTRQGKSYIGCYHITEDLEKVGLGDMFVDGELVYKNPEGLSDSDAFQKGLGIAMSKELSKPQLKLVIFDYFPMEEFKMRGSRQAYSQRLKNLCELENKIAEAGLENIEVVEMFYQGYDHSQINKCLQYAEEHDYEGCMINLDAPYECKRSKNLIKVKKFLTCDILCTGVEEGEGRYTSTLGAIVCDYKGNTLRVGSGFTDEDRNYFWNHKDKIIGKIVEVKYKEETKNKEGGISVQFPIYQGIRFDHSEPSYN